MLQKGIHQRFRGFGEQRVVVFVAIEFVLHLHLLDSFQRRGCRHHLPIIGNPYGTNEMRFRTKIE